MNIDQASTFGHIQLVFTMLKALVLLKICFSGQPMKTNLRLEDGRIGEQPEIIYHVFHTLSFGGLALLFDGCVDQCVYMFKIWISNITYW